MNYRVICTADGYQTTDFQEYAVAREYYNKIKAEGLNAEFVEL
jgi:hypothetical protein